MSGADNKLVGIQGGREKNPALDAIRQIQHNLAFYCEAQAALAAMTRSKYEALLKEGFTESQALELCK